MAHTCRTDENEKRAYCSPKQTSLGNHQESYERSKFPSEVIEKCLAHEEKNKIKGAYNRAEYLEQRRQLMQWWGNEVQQLEQGGSFRG